jgi:uridine kinase
MGFEALVAEILARPAAVRLVAVDGPGGAGKSTFARRLARHAGDVPVVPTDDFASWDVPLEWWPRMLAQVIEPMIAGETGNYQRFDWLDGRLAEWITVPRAPIVVIEGVSSGRREWSELLAYTVFVTTPEATRLRRGLDRDGDEKIEQWRAWMAEEESHYAADGVVDRADLVVDGHPDVPHDAETEFVIAEA